jgi:hypothetical protein
MAAAGQNSFLREADRIQLKLGMGKPEINSQDE